jgi:hypothetical protein
MCKKYYATLKTIKPGSQEPGFIKLDQKLVSVSRAMGG